MFEQLMTVTVRMVCGRCAQPACDYVSGVMKAIEAGKANGFVESGWPGSPLWLCPDCKVAIDKTGELLNLLKEFPGHRNEAEWNNWMARRDAIIKKDQG